MRCNKSLRIPIKTDARKKRWIPSKSPKRKLLIPKAKLVFRLIIIENDF